MDSAILPRVMQMARRTAGLAPEDELAPETPLVDGGLWLDSVMVLELLLELESEFGVELEADEMQSARALASCASLARFIEAKRHGG